MNQSTAVWVLILFALAAANLPFLNERLFGLIPLRMPKGEAKAEPSAQSGTAGDVERDIARDVTRDVTRDVAGDLAADVLQKDVRNSVRVRDMRSSKQIQGKSFFLRVIELILLYGLIGLLAYAFENSIGNPFKQRWEFYAITFSLFVVLAFPGFVIRYLMRRS